MITSAANARYGLFSVAILLLILGGAGLFVGSHSFAIRSSALFSIMASVYLVRKSGVRASATASVAKAPRPDLKLGNVSMRVTTAISLALVPIVGISLYFMEVDARNGYREIWPVYLFAVVAVICTVVWSYLVSQLLGRQ